MKRIFPLCLLVFVSTDAQAAPKTHVISFGKPMAVKYYVGTDESRALELKIRPLYANTRLKEYTTGSPREVTDRFFVVRRAPFV